MTVAAQTPAISAARAKKPIDSWRRHRRSVTLALLAAPMLAIAVLFVLPLLQLVWLSVAGDKDGVTFSAYAELMRPVYARLMLFTLELAAIVTVLCLVLSYPIAYLLANTSGAFVRWMATALFIGLWLSVLARTYGWIIILQRNGLLNQILSEAGLIQAPLSLVYNKTGVYIGMVHILMPFMIVTLIPMLRSIDPSLVRSGLSLGASPFMVFRRIYFPLSLPGVVAGSILVFTMALGFFITPAILGGGRATTIVMAIRNQVQQLIDLRLASATSVVLLAASLAILLIYEKVAGVERIFGTNRP
jgi:ABC-type spermidine/putrescine transport system permease subunit I